MTVVHYSSVYRRARWSREPAVKPQHPGWGFGKRCHVIVPLTHISYHLFPASIRYLKGLKRVVGCFGKEAFLLSFYESSEKIDVCVVSVHSARRWTMEAISLSIKSEGRGKQLAWLPPRFKHMHRPDSTSKAQQLADCKLCV